MPDMIRCEYESESFPKSQFTNDPKYGWVHEVKPRHLVDGDLLEPESISVPDQDARPLL